MEDGFTKREIIKIWVIGVGVILLITFIALWCVPQYRVWEQGLVGAAELKRAEQNKQVAVEAAKATRDSAIFQAEAEVERAKGVARANKIIGDSLKNNEEYLRYLWVNGLQQENGVTPQVVYVPTEANMPIFLESGRIGKQ